MSVFNPVAGKPVSPESLVNIPRLITAYFVSKPDVADPAQRVSFGTSGHRGSSLKNSFNEDHILATTQAICDHRRYASLTGPLFVGIDTHALAEPALVSAVEVFAANGVETIIQQDNGVTPAPVISRAIIAYNRTRKKGLAERAKRGRQGGENGPDQPEAVRWRRCYGSRHCDTPYPLGARPERGSDLALYR